METGFLWFASIFDNLMASFQGSSSGVHLLTAKWKETQSG